LAGLAKVGCTNLGKNALRLRHRVDWLFKAAAGKEFAFSIILYTNTVLLYLRRK
jgi:hypothetical protein